jgi:hypothetical protein
VLEVVDFWLQFLVCTMECVVINSDVGYVVGIVCFRHHVFGGILMISMCFELQIQKCVGELLSKNLASVWDLYNSIQL